MKVCVKNMFIGSCVFCTDANPHGVLYTSIERGLVKILDYSCDSWILNERIVCNQAVSYPMLQLSIMRLALLLYVFILELNKVLILELLHICGTGYTICSSNNATKVLYFSILPD